MGDVTDGMGEKTGIMVSFSIRKALASEKADYCFMKGSMLEVIEVSAARKEGVEHFHAFVPQKLFVGEMSTGRHEGYIDRQVRVEVGSRFAMKGVEAFGTKVLDPRVGEGAKMLGQWCKGFELMVSRAVGKGGVVRRREGVGFAEARSWHKGRTGTR